NTREKHMFRRILIASALGLGLATALAVPAMADARPPHEVHGDFDHHDRYRGDYHHRDFEVFYRDAHCNWKAYGRYRHRGEANRAAEQMRCRGFQVEIRPC